MSDVVTEADWLACRESSPMLFALAMLRRERERKLFLLTFACVRDEIISRPDGADALAVFERAADAQQPSLAMLKAGEQFPGHLRFDWNVYNLSKITANPYQPQSCDLLREIFGNPFASPFFKTAWRTTDVMLLAQSIYDARAFDRMPILADALQNAGCDKPDILDHCRDASLTHVRGCWVVDLVLGKE